MKCNYAQLMISLHIDNKLSLEEVAALMEHLEKCQKCRQLYKDFKDIKSILSDKHAPALNNAFTSSVMEKIKNTDIKKEDKIIDVIFIKKHLLMAASFIFIIAASAAFVWKETPQIIGHTNNDKQNSLNSDYNFYDEYNKYINSEDIYDEDIVSFLLLY